MKTMKFLICLFLFAIVVVLLASACMSLPRFGAKPKGERLARMQQSPNYKDGAFHNLDTTPNFASKEELARIDSTYRSFIGCIGGDTIQPSRKPTEAIDTAKVNLKNLPKEGSFLVWFGHSSYLIQVEGVRILVDPVFGSASPVRFINKPVSGTEPYSAADIPEVDFLIITHDHYDHLDFTTCKTIREKVGTVICPLGVGAHLERWHYGKDQIVELDWWQTFTCGETSIHCLPQRHFSGRTLKRNPTLWASFMVERSGKTVFLGGDGGYGTHFKQIGEKFPRIDYAVLENGQYNPRWAYIHTLPYQFEQLIADLGVKKITMVHHGKYAESVHPWNEPDFVIKHLSKDSSLFFIQPVIGAMQPLDL